MLLLTRPVWVCVPYLHASCLGVSCELRKTGQHPTVPLLQAPVSPKESWAAGRWGAAPGRVWGSLGQTELACFCVLSVRGAL